MRIASTALVLLFVSLSGCDSSPGTTQGGSGGGGSGGSSGGAGGSGASAGNGGGGAGGSTPTACDGVTLFCDQNTYCDAPAGTCPSVANPGTCVPRPDDCTGVPDQPTCACDGQVYVNGCEAQAAGLDAGPQAGCMPPPNAFTCGSVLCDGGTQFCQDVNGHDYCTTVPGGCEPPNTTCTCLEPAFCMAAPGLPECTSDAQGHFFVHCTVTE